MRIGAAAPRLAAALEAQQSVTDRVADVEAGAGAAVMSVAKPADVALQLVDGIEAVPLEQALRQAQCHGGVVGPLPCRQVEWAAADDVGQRLEGAGVAELHRRPECVTGGQAEECTPIAVDQHGHRICDSRDRCGHVDGGVRSCFLHECPPSMTFRTLTVMPSL